MDSPIVDGYRVQTFFGERLGSVVGVSTHSVVIRRSSRFGLRRTIRAVPLTLTTVQESERRVTVLVARDVIDRSPGIEPSRPVDDAGIHLYYQRALRTSVSDP